MVDFWRGAHSWQRFDAFVEKYQLHPRSWLSWARANDVDAYEAAHRAGTLTRGEHRIETFEWGQAEQLLSGIYSRLGELAHITAQKGAKHPKRYRDRPWPSPRTGLDELKARAKAAASRASREFMSMFVPVPQAEFDAEIAEHHARLEREAADEQAAVMARLARHRQPDLADQTSDPAGAAPG